MTTITHVTTAVVQANFDYTYARIHTDAGIHGTGEAFFAPGGPSTIRDLGELLVGHDPTRIRALTERLTRGAGGTANIGMAFHAISGLEAALWDLNGKLADKPVVDILGGRFRDAVEVYADLHSGSELRSMDNVMRYREPFWSSADGTTQTGQFFWEAAEEEVLSIELIVERASEAIKAGFRRIKFDLDVFGTDREASDRSIGRREVDQIAEYAMALRDTGR